MATPCTSTPGFTVHRSGKIKVCGFTMIARSLLRHLSLSSIDMSRALDWPRVKHEKPLQPEVLESLDLSKNMLSGEIPSSLSKITYLSFLNLSENNLAGRIPPGSQLDTLYQEHRSIYDGNTGLCGPPLQKNCSANGTSTQDDQKITSSGFEPMSFRFGLVLGLIVGIWLALFTLLFMKAWKTAYFRLFDKLYDQIYVSVLVKWRRLARAGTAD
ncbi:Leucine-rich repeat receptor protein kinase EXS [Hordeum vulgare]|nr:Leucine-rich repeat receptor protein kinase EXS [Hordeum vulgare]